METPVPTRRSTSFRLPAQALELLDQLAVRVAARRPIVTRPNRTETLLLAIDALHRELTES